MSIKIREKISVISINEYKELKRKGFILINKKRSFIVPKTIELKQERIGELLLRFQDIGINSDLYIITVYNQTPDSDKSIYYTINKSSKNEVIDIRYDIKFYTFTEYAKEFLNIDVETNFSDKWELFLKQKIYHEHLFKGYFFIDLFYNKTYDKNKLLNYSIDNYCENVPCTIKEIFENCKNFSETYAFGWRVTT